MPSTPAASAYERLATAWVRSAAIGHEEGISLETTPFTYWLTLTALITFSAPAWLWVGTTSSAPR